LHRNSVSWAPHLRTWHRSRRRKSRPHHRLAYPHDQQTSAQFPRSRPLPRHISPKIGRAHHGARQTHPERMQRVMEVRKSGARVSLCQGLGVRVMEVRNLG
jgi:hypothetical protein